MESISFSTSPGKEFHLTFLPGMLALFGEGHFQYFRNEENLDSDCLQDLFPSDAAIIDRAQLHKEGLLDKNGFMEIVRKDSTLQASQKMELTRFIMSCDCPPGTVRAKLTTMGYGGYVNQLVVEEPDPQLVISIGLVNHLLQIRRDL